MDLLAQEVRPAFGADRRGGAGGFPAIDAIKAVPYDMEWAGQGYATLIKRWQDIIVRVK